MVMGEYYFKDYRANSIAFYDGIDEWMYNTSVELNDIEVCNFLYVLSF